MNYVVESYENYREEDRLTTNNARRIEFITTMRVLEEVLRPGCSILDCAAGTGVYAFPLAEKGFDVTATDITPRHIRLIDERLAAEKRSMRTAVLDAADMSIFADGSFDVVLNMGPMYHLTEGETRERCMRECTRVLKKGGLLVTAYIPRYFVFAYVAMHDDYFVDAKLARQLIETGVLRHDDEKCFWTDTYYSSKVEMEALYGVHGLRVTDHFAQDGLAPLLAAKVDGWNETQFATWCDYHYSICREPSVLGASNHAVVIGEKL